MIREIFERNTMDCIFCKIAKKELSADILFEDAEVAVFKDIKPYPPVHYLAIPKRHIASVADLAPSDQDAVFRMIIAMRDAAARLGLKGYKLLFNVGQEGGQIIPHLHLHLLGRWARGDDERILHT